MYKKKITLHALQIFPLKLVFFSIRKLQRFGDTRSYLRDKLKVEEPLILLDVLYMESTKGTIPGIHIFLFSLAMV